MAQPIRDRIDTYDIAEEVAQRACSQNVEEQRALWEELERYLAPAGRHLLDKLAVHLGHLEGTAIRETIAVVLEDLEWEDPNAA